jgi:hypothetical protein|tara:strand:- start:4536 stop:4748 length:213 start_codon:yes stop_codon:yes gene_type:complete
MDEITKDGIYNQEMDNCIRASSILYARLFELGERIHMADERSNAELSAYREISKLLGQKYRRAYQRSFYS